MTKSGFYTAVGDRGDTGRLGGKQRLSKSDALMEVIGAVDEATSAIGMARALAHEVARAAREVARTEALLTIQQHLSRLMAHLSATPDARERFPGVSEDEVAWLEELIAQMEEGLPPLKEFVYPGDSVPGAALHVARAAIRRAERRIVAFTEVEPGIGAVNLAYVNRLSSLLFVAALREDQHET